MQIEKWWPRVGVEAKQWLRENQGSADVPDDVRAGIVEAGGPSEGQLLTDEDWQFIRTQSEYVD
ncbi:hypothetical protein [Arthrobacter sp. Br18]|uniref:hypothetical protein n=1 Tax=Arthrobacter sp. Br18 TaxID=1312954 RepID=UPI00047A944F|nr:hypothetical protein [Arthrobacter sp. Br18]